MKKNFLVIGLGEFGKSVAKTLYKNKATVMAIDSNEELIKQALNEGILDEAVILDATDEIALRNVVKDDFDMAFVSVGDNIQASILITLHLKELGIDHIICKAVYPREGLGEDRGYSSGLPRGVYGRKNRLFHATPHHH